MEKRKQILLAVMASYFLSGFMGSAMVVAVPAIGLSFGMGVTMTGWIVSGFVLASAMMLMPAGKFADYIGYPPIFKAGIASFAVTSFACAFAPSGEWLIVFRFLQGIASALIFCTGMAIISLIYPPEERGTAIGWTTFMVYTGLSIGPALGGFLNSLYGWRSILHVTWVLTAFATVYAFNVLGSQHKKGEKVSDFVGMILFMLMVLLIFGGLSVPNIYGITAFGFGLVFMAIMTVYEYRHPSPMINVRLFFGNRTFGSANTASMLNYCATAGVLFLVSIEMQLIYGLSSEKAGFVMLSQSVAMMIVTPFAGKISDKANPKTLASLGMLIMASVLTVMAFVTGKAQLTVMVILLFIQGIGIGLFSTPNNTVIMNSVEKKYYGFASSTLGTMRLMGQTFSIALAVISLTLFAGSAKLSEINSEGLTHALRTAFIIFAVFSAAGAFLSLTGRNLNNK